MKQPQDTAAASENAAIYRDLPIAKIRPDPKNRKAIAGDIALLAESIKAEGQLQPIVVRQSRDEKSDTDFMLVAGERRWRAHQQLKRATISARVLPETENKSAVVKQVVENVQREDLTPVQTAQQYQRLLDEGYSHPEVAGIVGRSPSDVSNTLRLLKLPADTQKLIDMGALSRAHGVTLARFAPWPVVCDRLAAVAVARGTPAKELEKGMPLNWEPAVHKVIARDYVDAIPKEWAKDPDFILENNHTSGWVTCLKPEKFGMWKNAQKALAAERAAKVVQAEKSGKLTAEQAAAKRERAAVLVRNKKRREEIRAGYQSAIKGLSKLETPTARELAVLASEAIAGGYYSARIKEVAAALGLKLVPGVVSGNGNGLRNLAVMSKMKPADVTRLAVGVILSKQADDACREARGFAPSALNLYLKGGAK